MLKTRRIRFTHLIALLLGVMLGFTLTPIRASQRAQAGVVEIAPPAAPYIGYGISVAPHLPSRPDMLDELGMNWVKIYDTAQIPDYPNQKVLYRIDMRGYPDDIDAWERGLRDLARELQGLGVAAVEIGNEANLAVEWGGQPPNAAEFTDALCRSYNAFKETAPEIVVVAGGLAPTHTAPDRSSVNDLEFAQELFNHGVGRCFDAWGYHPYGFNQPPEANPYDNEYSFRRTERMRRVLTDNGVFGKQVWITEFGWVRDPAEEGLNCTNNPLFVDFNWVKFSADTQAGYTARAFGFADANWPWVGPMFLWNLNWNLYDTSYEPECSHLRWYAILNRDGAPLPVYYSVLNVDKRLPDRGTRPPAVGAVVHGLTQVAEAGCAGQIHMGTFTIANKGATGNLDVEIVAANGPTRPFVWTNVTHGTAGTKVDVYAEAAGIPPGLHMIAVNLRAYGVDRLTSDVVRGWLLIRPPTTPECVAKFGGDG